MPWGFLPKRSKGEQGGERTQDGLRQIVRRMRKMVPEVYTEGEYCLWYRTDFVPVCVPVTGETGGWALETVELPSSVCRSDVSGQSSELSASLE